MRGKQFGTILMCVLCVTSMTLNGQFTSGEKEEFAKWEDFLLTAEITGSQQMLGSLAVTEPWVLTLEKDGITRRALWKNPSGRVKGYFEGWQWEIAAYRLSEHLGLHMVPPTVERRFRNDRGSIQLWIEDVITMQDKIKNNIRTPGPIMYLFNRALFMQRAFDNLIANTDRHQRQYLITEDSRILLIDHSRSFRSSKKYRTELIYSDKDKKKPYPMNQLPRHFYEKIKILTMENVREVVGEYLEDRMIEALLDRRDLIVLWIDARCDNIGEENVLYDL
ncbi:MAG: hypothetical protein KKD59_07985 [Acidobacteria bacterium]|nr:hypothetical protein [Acidobacteriota bacterium]MCG2814450.1 hypothetical protein [Candidatus Aminicenantes bacterium]